MIRKRLTKRGTEPRLVVTITGEADIYRLARFCEMQGLRNGTFMRWHTLGLSVLRGLDRQRPGSVQELTQALGPLRVTHRGRRPRQLKLELGSPPEVAEAIAEAVR